MRLKLICASIFLALLFVGPSVFCSEEFSDTRTLIDSDSSHNPEEESQDSQPADGVLYDDDQSGNPILAEPLVDDDDAGDDEEEVVLDENSRVVAEQLIQELDNISEKLKDDDETITDSKAISPADISKLEHILEAAGFGKSSVPAENDEEVPKADALVGMPGDLGALGGLGGLGALGALGGGLGGLGALGGMGGMVPPTSLTKRKIEEIKGELRYMLFGPELVKRRQDTFPPPGHPGDRRRIAGPGPGPGPLSRQRVQSSGFLSSFRNRNRKPDPKHEFNRNGNFPLQQGSNPVPGFVANGRPHPNGGPPPPNVRAPINEFRQQPSSFRLPTDPSQQGPVNFNPPPNNFRNPQFLPGGPGNSRLNPQLSAPPPPRIPPPNQGPPQRPHFQPSKPENTPLFRPSESIPRPGLVESEGFRPISPDSVPKQQQPPPAAPQRPSLNQNAIKVGSSIRTGNLNPSQGFNNRPTNLKNSPPQQRNKEPECANYMDSVCLEARNYPGEIIMTLLNRNKPISEAMLAEVRSQSADDLVEGISAADERKYTYSHYYGNRRQGEDTHAHRDFAADGGFLCPSEVRYAKPQLAQNSRGTWKYIVNVEEHTQTVRMEHCLKPSKGCSYVSPHYKSQCAQLYNYHRLMSWDEQRGLHVDIYKIPAACTCHINGYTHSYPPLDGKPFEVAPSGRSASNSSSSASSRKTPNSRVKFPERPERPPVETTSAPRSPSSTSGSPTRNFGFDSDFTSFMDNFSGPFGSFPSNSFGKRADDEPAEVKYVDNQAVEDVIRQKTNYDYHPIIEFFQNRDKPRRS